VTFGPELTAAEAALYESLVVPRYMRWFAGPAVSMLIPYDRALVAQLGCRTGFPAEEIGRQMPHCAIHGVDNSSAALELARTKVSLVSGISAEFVHAPTVPTPLRADAYTHSFGLHTEGGEGGYGQLFAEHHRVLVPGGQMVASLPLRGSFPEVYDMLREYALRSDEPHLGEAIDIAAARRPNPETLAEQIEAAGFTEVDVGVELVGVSFKSGRDFVDDPIARLVVGPDVQVSIPGETGIAEAWDYAIMAIGKYWSEIAFELTINVGCVSARKVS